MEEVCSDAEAQRRRIHQIKFLLAGHGIDMENEINDLISIGYARGLRAGRADAADRLAFAMGA